MLSVRMRLILLMVFLSTSQINAAAVKKSIEEASQNKIVDSSKPVSKKEIPAIIAIEIVDESESNATTGKSNPKRTIESSLGYGYHGHSNSYGLLQSTQPDKKFVIYKYQNNIAPTSDDSSSNGHSNIQKSIGYKLQTITSHTDKSSLGDKVPNSAYVTSQPLSQYYNPRTTLYTTYDQHGLGGVSNQVPYQNVAHSNMVPVIILRVYSNQLQNPGTALHTNLPQSNPYSDLNSINLQTYLQDYVQQYLQSHPRFSYQPNYEQQYQQTYVPNYQIQTNPSTYRNYPSQPHTRVLYASNTNAHSPIRYNTAGLSSYKSVSYPSYVAPQPAYANDESANVQYVYDNSAQPQYMYVYQNPQVQYYQDGNSQYDSNEDYPSAPNYLQQEEVETSTKQPYNYHAHSIRESPKDKRSRLEKVISATSQEKES